MVLELQAGQTVIVNYQTRDIAGESAAMAGSDYTATSGTLTFTRGAEGKAQADPIPLEITQDTLNEDIEDFEVAFGEATLPDDATTTPGPIPVTIDDDDPIYVRLSASPTSVPEGETVRFTVTLSGGTSTEAVAIRYTLSGDVTRGDDYFAPAGTLTIGTDSTSGTFTIRTATTKISNPPKVCR